MKMKVTIALRTIKNMSPDSSLSVLKKMSQGCKHEHAILVLIALTIILVNVPLKAEYQALHKSLHDE